MDRWEVEEFILSMADIVYENHRLRKELEQMKEYEQKYHDLIDQNAKQAGKNQEALLEAIMMGAFATNK